MGVVWCEGEFDSSEFTDRSVNEYWVFPNDDPALTLICNEWE